MAEHNRYFTLADDLVTRKIYSLLTKQDNNYLYMHVTTGMFSEWLRNSGGYVYVLMHFIDESEKGTTLCRF